MSYIKASKSLSGRISGGCTLSGSLSSDGGLSGKISVSTEYDSYDEDYEVIPNAFNTQILHTANKVLRQDVTVEKVPYYETSNVQNGITVYIAGEEN